MIQPLSLCQLSPMQSDLKQKCESRHQESPHRGTSNHRPDRAGVAGGRSANAGAIGSTIGTAVGRKDPGRGCFVGRKGFRSISRGVDNHGHSLLAMSLSSAVHPERLRVVDHNGKYLHQSILRGERTGADTSDIGQNSVDRHTRFVEGRLSDGMHLCWSVMSSSNTIRIAYLGIKLELDHGARLCPDLLGIVFEGCILGADLDNLHADQVPITFARGSRVR